MMIIQNKDGTTWFRLEESTDRQTVEAAIGQILRVCEDSTLRPLNGGGYAVADATVLRSYFHPADSFTLNMLRAGWQLIDGQQVYNGENVEQGLTVGEVRAQSYFDG